ncbi:MAG: carbohydrate kinase family protein [Kiritimatiellae bacterium]|nr:carbohydrate kinase family protein [Kiritimatiellia bacterium]
MKNASPSSPPCPVPPSRILVSGLLNVETSVPVEGFPVTYVPVTYPDGTVRTAASGVALNLACALAALGDAPSVLAPVAGDAPSALVRRALAEAGIPADGLVPILPETPLSVVLHAPGGARRIYCDLKAAQSAVFPPEVARAAFAPSACPDLAILCNINYSRPLLPLARAAGVPVATDLHVVSDPDDAYDADFIRAADILFLSHEGLPCAPADFISALAARSPARIIVVTQGDAGATLWERATGRTTHQPATATRPVANTVGAGDACLAAFVHHWLRGDSPVDALLKAQLFASWKTGESGGARGFPAPGTYSDLLARFFR